MSFTVKYKHNDPELFLVSDLYSEYAECFRRQHTIGFGKKNHNSTIKSFRNPMLDCSLG
ncbi:MAG: hypothetical protein FD131_2266 [Rhodocyclaceae bacterium]|nr:MAG: hypothetical protein FD131_2266 [Rhodocyclaceae bacterium]